MRSSFLYSILMRLAALQSESGMYALAHVGCSEWLFRQFGLNPLEENAQKSISHLEVVLGSFLADSVSGLVVDPLYGFELSQLGKSDEKHAIGIAWRLVEESQSGQVPTALKGWGVEETKNAYGVVYLELSYNPAEQHALQKKQFVFEVADYCRVEGIDFILDIATTNSDSSRVHPDSLAEVQLATVQEMRSAPSMFVLDYPGNSLAAATLTAEVDVPWLVSAGTTTYPDFKSQLRDALGSGAKGYVAGWQFFSELAALRNPDTTPQWSAIEEMTRTTVRDRFLELSRICEEAGSI